MLFAINAYEDSYNGLHGMENKFVVECDSEEEAQEYAREASYEVMDSYGCIDNYLWESVGEGFSEKDNNELTDEDFEAYDVERDENIAYEIYRLRDDTELTVEKLDEMASSDWDELIEKYAVSDE